MENKNICEEKKLDNQELLDLREKIDSIDKEIAKLFNERMKLIDEIIIYKTNNSLPIFSKSRENEIKENNSKFISENYTNYYLDVLDSILKNSKKYQEKIIKSGKKDENR